jgi:FkbM family methyltransferase
MASEMKRSVVNARNKAFGVTQIDAEIAALSSKLDELEKRRSENDASTKKALKDIDDRLHNAFSIILSETEIVTKLFSGLKMFINPKDLSVGIHIALDNSWEWLITKAWLSLVERDSVVLDIGANFGYFGALAAQKTDKKKSKVVFFEANPSLTPYINKTLSLNWLNEQAVVENLAVADKAGEVTLHVLKDYIGSSSLHSNKRVDTYMHNKMKLETAVEVKVKATTIDDYCKKNAIDAVDLIKMDIEGYEEKAYQGMREIVKASPNASLFIEFTKDGYEKPKQFYEQMLKDFGNVYLIDGHGRFEKPQNTSYESVIGDVDDWVMPVFSKNSKLDTK